jgi:hypothetical protein
VVRKRYADYPQLLDYCRRSANPVGRLLLHLVGRQRREPAPLGLHLFGAATDQFLAGRRDRLAKGRVYLPQADLARSAWRKQIAAGCWTPNGRPCSISRSNARTRPDASRRAAGAAAAGPHGLGDPLTVQGGLRILERIRRFAATFSGSARSWAERLAVHRWPRTVHVSVQHV